MRSFQIAAFWLISVAAFFLPLGTAPMKFFLWIGLLISIPIAIKNYREVIKSRVVLFSTLLLTWIIISSLWSSGSGLEIGEFLSRYARLGMVGFLVAVLNVEFQSASTIAKVSTAGSFLGKGWGAHLFPLRAFVAGAFVAAFVTWITWLGIPHYLASVPLTERVLLGPSERQIWLSFGTPTEPNFAYSHIAASSFLVFAANFVFFDFFGKRKVLLRIFGVIFLVTPVLMMQSRTGYLLLMISFLVWALSTFRQSGLRGDWSSLLILVSVFLIAAATVSHTSKRTFRALDEAQNYLQTGKYEGTSQGVRLQLWSGAITQAFTSPSSLLVGHGVGSYSTEYKSRYQTSVPEPSGQPHSEWLSMLSQFGAVGLVLFGGLVWAMYCVPPPQVALKTLTLLLAVDSAFNSVLWNMEEGHFMLFFLAVLGASELRRGVLLRRQHLLGHA
jgi:hypothetical protein